MFFAMGCFLSTSLYVAIIFILGMILKGKFDTNNIVFYIACTYPILLIIDQVMLKVTSIRDRKKGKIPLEYNFFSDVFKTIFYNLIIPFRHIGTFLSIITKKHIIRDDSKFHNICDFMQALIGFVFALFIIIMAIIYLI